jgi:hypothetical protein
MKLYSKLSGNGHKKRNCKSCKSKTRNTRTNRTNGKHTYRRKNKKNKKKRTSRGGGVMLNMIRTAGFNINSGFNTLNAESAPVNPLPYKDQFAESKHI